MRGREIDQMLAKWDEVLAENDRVMLRIKPRKRLDPPPHNTDETGRRNDAGFPGQDMPKRKGW